MEDKKKRTNSTLPPNYVSLAQLKERWLKEKEREQREKDEEEEREKRLQEKEREQREKVEEEEGRRGEQRFREENRGNRGLTKDGEKSSCEFQSGPATQRRSRRKDWKVYRKVRGKIEDGQLKPEENEESMAVAVAEVKRLDETEEPKQKSKKKKKKRRIRAKNKTTGAMARSENEPEHRTPMIVTEKKYEMKVGWKQSGEAPPVASGEILGEKAPIHQVVEVGRIFENLSMNDGRREYGNYGRYNRFEVRRRRGCSRVWVKKGETTSDGNAGDGPGLTSY